MSLTYDSFVTDLANLVVVSSADTNFQTVLPNIIDDAEQRIYRECDFLRTVAVTQSTASCTIFSNTRSFTLPSSISYIVLNSMSVLSTANSLTSICPVSRDWLNVVYPTATSTSSAAIPLYYAMVTDQQVLVGPPPGADTTVQVTGTTRPTALSSNNSSTYLTQSFPGLFMASALTFVNGYIKNFSAMSDDPQAPATWEKHYQNLKQSVLEEEARKKLGPQ